MANKKVAARIIAVGALVAFSVAFGSACVTLQGQQAVAVDIFWDTALLQNVTRITDDGLPKRWARISPDGNQMLYAEWTNSRWNIVLLRDVTVHAKTPLITGGVEPAWHGNNNNFLFMNDGRLVRSAVTGGGRTYVTRNPVGTNDARPVIRDGVILLDTGFGGNRQIVSMRENGTEVTFLGEGHSPSWHPTEPRFVFIRNGNVFEMDLASLQATQLFSDDRFMAEWPSYAAGGEFILFQMGAEQRIGGTAVHRVGGRALHAMRITDTRTNLQLFIMRSNGQELSTLTVGEVNSFSPTWCEVNGFVYFISNATGRDEIYRARVNIE